jgi:hypothetical protein
MKKTDRELIFNKYGGKCAYCGCELEKGWHTDHIEPIVRDFIYNRNKQRFETIVESSEIILHYGSLF